MSIEALQLNFLVVHSSPSFFIFIFIF
ncbi:unnamed protein product [Cuscuta epithymum]|uniref:Uncharacterized protein n=1 Tax=Cuscuta epithymum TaxID=186058 RepID=A0AAV0ESH7_9ASTE|nr:unnamed protein product [Cuscuta epithymum]